jgi:ATP-binding cassette subfamily C protein
MGSALQKSTKPPMSELRTALAACRDGFIGVGVASAIVNVLTLAGSIYMLQVYDRVIPSRSGVTLVGLTLILVVAYVAYGTFDVVRAQLLAAIGRRLERILRQRVFTVFLSLPLRASGAVEPAQPLRDLEQIRSFVASLGPTALFDLPWLPIFMVLIFLMHPLLGLTATLGALVIVAMTVLTEKKSRQPIARAAQSSSRRHGFTEAARRNAEVTWALGMQGKLTQRWLDYSADYHEDQARAQQVAIRLGTASKVFRLFLQSAVLGVGAYLVIRQEASGGIMIAASILTSRALAPIEVAIANWRSFVSARQSYERLDRVLLAMPAPKVALQLPSPKASLTVDNLAVVAPGQQRLLVQDVSFSVEAGAGVGIIGPSASGKSTIARALVGVWRPARGSVRLDGSTLDQWHVDDLGSSIGYLPQDVELFDGTIADNIARFTPGTEPAAVLQAAKAAGVHDMIVRLPEGYGTRIGEGGAALSAGQRQRVALARALFGDPFLVVLDEPNSNLDSEGEDALAHAIRLVRERGGIVVVIAHRPSALAAIDQLLVMAQGRPVVFGPRDEVLRQALRPAVASAAPGPQGGVLRPTIVAASQQ